MAAKANQKSKEIAPQPNATFEITSGALCFGNRQEIHDGAMADIQSPSRPEFQGPGGGTVMAHVFQYNFKALNGPWNVYKLPHKSNNNRVYAAFCCHASVSGEQAFEEVKRVVETANAPWEPDFGAMKNTEKTWEGRVIVINRYDWAEDYYGEEEDGITAGEDDDDDDDLGPGQRNSRFLVDYQHAKETCQEKEIIPPEERWCTEGLGIRLVILGEYMYGRFGLVEDRSCVQSFLFFTGDAELSQTIFRGGDNYKDRPIYVPLTDEQRHARRLADGSYMGYDWLRTTRQMPDLVGPFGVEDMISLETMEVLLQKCQPHAPDIRFAPELHRDMMILLNESLAVWVYCLGRLAAENSDATQTTVTTRDDFLREAFPNAFGRNTSSIHAQQLKAMNNEPNSGCMIDSNISSEALYKIVPSTHRLWTFLTIPEVSCGMQYLLQEILELAGNCARDHSRTVVVPLDVRIAINNDRELCEECLNCSKIFWPPDMTESTATATTTTATAPS